MRLPAVTTWPDDCFERFWCKYPRKVAKQHALKAFEKIRRSRKVSFGVLMSGVQQYAEAVAGKDAQYVAHPSTWLNGKRWEDYLTEETRPKSPNGVFVGEGTPAWDAWQRSKPRGYPCHDCKVDGRLMRGWFFPTEFPPGYEQGHEVTYDETEAR